MVFVIERLVAVIFLKDQIVALTAITRGRDTETFKRGVKLAIPVKEIFFHFQ